MDDVFARISRLSPEKRELLFGSLSRAAAPDNSIPRRSQSDEAPLSFAQQRLWFLDQLSDLKDAYHIPLRLALRGSLNPAALKRSLELVIARHDVLRAFVIWNEDQPQQRITTPSPWSLPMIDLSVLSNEQSGLLRTLMDAEMQRPFFLERGPLWRALLLRLAPQEHVLLVTLHHFVADGWSLGVLTNDLAACYTGDVSNSQPDLSPLTIQYPDFAAWQQELWKRGDFEPDLRYWTSRLASFAPLMLPTDTPRPALPTYRGASESLLIPHRLSRRLDACCRQQDVTLFTLLLAAFHALLARWTLAHDIAVGTPVAGRNGSPLEGLIGCFVNTLVMRADLSGGPTFRHLLAQVRESILEDFAHAAFPFEKLVERLRPRRDPAINPLVQVLFAVHNTPLTAPEMPGVQVEFLEVQSDTSRFDLELNAWEVGEGIRLIATYNVALFRSSTIVQLLEKFQALLETVAADIDVSVTGIVSFPSEPENLATSATAAVAENAVYQPPESDLERQIAELFASMLGVPGVGREDDFFALGGDSLSAAQMVRRLREKLQTPLELRWVFEARTPRNLAAHIEALDWAGRPNSVDDAEHFEF